METESSHIARRSSLLDLPSSILNSPSTIFVVGAGGIGCTVGYGLLAAGLQVVFVESNPNKVAWGRTQGVGIDRRKLIGIDQRKPLEAHFISFDDWNPPARATVVLCTMCYDNARVLARLPSDATLVPIQNGFDPALNRRIHLEGIASFVSYCSSVETQARITRRGRLHFGFRSDHPPSSWPGFVHALQSCNLFQTVLVPNILPFKYSKLMYNAAIGPLAAAAGLDNGDLLRIPMARRFFFHLLLENYTILHNAHIPLGTIGPFHPDQVARILRRPWLARSLALAFYPSLQGSYCSMFWDLRGVCMLLKDKTEIEYYNRHLIDLAGDRPCPLNRRVYDLIKRMESERSLPCLEMLEELGRN